MASPATNRDHFTDLIGCLRGYTYTLGVLPVVYGTLTIAFGEDLWPVAVYHSAQEVPGAPQSWGSVAIVAGAAIVGAQRLRVNRWILAGCLVMTLWTMFFAVAFITDGVKQGQVSGYAPAVVYMGISALYANRAVLAYKWRFVQ